MSLDHLTGARCLACGEELRRFSLACPACHATGSLETTYDLEEVGRSMDRESLERREPWMWRFKELLPYDELAELPPLQLGMTPVFGAPRLAAWLGVGGLWIKDEGRNPTGSLDDRFAALAVTAAHEAGRARVVRACRGTDGLALSCLAASFGMQALLVVPEASGDIDAAALAQAERLGARVARARGGWDEALAASRAAAARLDAFDANGDEPALADGWKTVGLEIAEQLCERLPDWVAVSLDDGLALAAIARGMAEMKALGIARAVPRLLSVERSEASAGPSEAQGGDGASPEERGPSTVARARGAAALRLTRGAMVAVGEEAREEASLELARAGAVLAGASGARAAAGVREAVRAGIIETAETVLMIVDGGPLADHPAAKGEPRPVAATLDEVVAALSADH